MQQKKHAYSKNVHNMLPVKVGVDGERKGGYKTIFPNRNFSFLFSEDDRMINL